MSTLYTYYLFIAFSFFIPFVLYMLHLGTQETTFNYRKIATAVPTAVSLVEKVAIVLLPIALLTILWTMYKSL